MRYISRHLFGLTYCCALMLVVSSVIQANEHPTLVVPFELTRHRVIIPTSVNGSRPLKLILDSGMGFDGVYLFHKEAIGLMDTTGAVEVRVPGAGSGEASTATMIESGRLAFGDVTIEGQRVIVSRSEHTQSFPTDGIIGWSLFGHYLVDIDYDLGQILLRDTADVPSDSGWLIVPIELKKNIPFLQVTVEVKAGEAVPMTVYIDLASEEALELLVRDGQKFTMPDSLTRIYLGTGLSGDIYGMHGRSSRVTIGNFQLSDVKTAFADAQTRSKQEGADGVFGNDLIRRFNVIFDYAHRRLYLRPNKTFGQLFE